eukprot:1161866-Pelagomonas_calceolata.AAC.2
MEVVLSKADGAHAEGSWAVGGKQQDSSLDGHGPVVMAQRPEEHEKVRRIYVCVGGHGSKG